ncbi:MAG: tetratricopeptide repeat protein [Ignavibacteriota bacterium]
MRKLAMGALAAVLITLPVLGTGCQKLQARDHLNKGVNAFKNAQYPEAVEHFKQAVELDPNYPIARLYLATAYMQQYIPGAESPENKQMADAAENTFKDVLKDDAKNETAIAYLASLYLNEKRWDDANAWYEQVDHGQSEERRRLLQQGFHRLVEVVSGRRYCPRQPGHEARRSRSYQG